MNEFIAFKKISEKIKSDEIKRIGTYRIYS